MSSRTLVPLVALALAGCARHTIPPVVLTPQTRIGPAEDFGPGIVAYTSVGMDFVLDTAAHVIVLRVTDSKRVETVQPLRRADRTELARGKHHVMDRGFRFMSRSRGYDASTSCAWGAVSPYSGFAGAFDSTGAFRASSGQSYDTCVRHEQSSAAMFRLADGTPRQAETPNEAYWLLIVSDVATRADDLEQRLALMEWPGSAVTAVRNLPEALVGGRTARWAAYYVPFGTPGH